MIFSCKAFPSMQQEQHQDSVLACLKGKVMRCRRYPSKTFQTRDAPLVKIKPPVNHPYEKRCYQAFDAAHIKSGFLDSASWSLSSGSMCINMYVHTHKYQTIYRYVIYIHTVYPSHQLQFHHFRIRQER